MSYFSQPKSQPKTERDKQDQVMTPGDANENKVDSTIGASMFITGSIVCAGSMQICGRVAGEIHAAQLTICEGALVEGKVTAQETIVGGAFKGTIFSNTVKLQNTAVVDGEIYKNSLTIDGNAQFEGMSRRLEKPIEAPTSAQIQGELASIVPAVGPAGVGGPMSKATS